MKSCALAAAQKVILMSKQREANSGKRIGIRTTLASIKYFEVLRTCTSKYLYFEVRSTSYFVLRRTQKLQNSARVRMYFKSLCRVPAPAAPSPGVGLRWVRVAAGCGPRRDRRDAGVAGGASSQQLPTNTRTNVAHGAAKQNACALSCARGGRLLHPSPTGAAAAGGVLRRTASNSRRV